MSRTACIGYIIPIQSLPNLVQFTRDSQPEHTYHSASLPRYILGHGARYTHGPGLPPPASGSQPTDLPWDPRVLFGVFSWTNLQCCL